MTVRPQNKSSLSLPNELTSLQAIKYAWVNIVPFESPSHTGTYPIIPVFLEYLTLDDAVFYAYAFCGFAHWIARHHGIRGLRNPPPDYLEMKGKALKQLQRKVDTLKDAMPSDAMLNMILALSSHELNEEAIARNPPSYPQSPLAKVQVLNSVGYMKTEPAHFHALYRLVQLRGGLQNIRTFGIAHTIALYALSLPSE
jgi:hypothetical protein